jgi:cell division protein FtsQ
MYGDEAGLRPQVHSRGDRKLKRILSVITFILGVELVWLFGVSPCMPLSKITISGIPGIDENAVLALAGIGKQSSFLTVNTKSAEEALLALPMVRSARVIKKFPNRVELYLENRRAAAMAFVATGERTFPALIDGEGMIFNVGREGFIQNEQLPVISGLVLEGVYPGMKLPRMYNTLFARLETLTREAP